MGSSKKKFATTSSQREPWDQTLGYLVGGQDQAGLLPEAGKNYAQSDWMPEQEAARSRRQSDLNQQGVRTENAGQVANTALTGGFDPRTQGYLPRTFSGMGAVDPTKANAQMLTGEADMSRLNPVVQNASRRLTDNFNEQVMPGIRSSNTATGGVGSTRQGIAEGIAAKGLTQSIGDMQAKMYSDAFDKAQDRMRTTSDMLSRLSILGNQQAGAEAKQIFDTRLGGLSTQAIGDQGADHVYRQRDALFTQPQDQRARNIQRYRDTVLPVSQLGEQVSNYQTKYRNRARDFYNEGPIGVLD